MYNRITEYLGIEEELINEKENQEGIKEAKEIIEKYGTELESGRFAYCFRGDLCRMYDKESETVKIIEEQNQIVVFEIQQNKKEAEA